ncbi:unnamed protein product [Rotaria sordida]|uniref:Uncharacterized protein n=1 Tax=Rotaria sordida TaxID=392033 RepID=A0A818XR09_9BILA|nr:unnamed protein product [Rotaria sordida]CAF1087563.1 unnamed protein product [Rotaria sordida]CAF1125521.1 unnamed protein product [Rotaria sordida]CAF1300713.1 unnamed protein product [Rotaria sordida]CAF1452578.1 unnamed protein product [Rotaria sordida]
MTSTCSNTVSSVKVNDNSNRHCHEIDHHRVHTKRAVTLDVETHKEKLRIVVLGATKVGKTCLCQQFLQEKFLIDHKETVDELHSVEISLVDRRIILEILDTAGIDEFPVMRRIAIAHGDAFLILYAVNDIHSFDIAKQMYQLVLEIKTNSTTQSIPIIIVANKCDLEIEKHEITQEYAKNTVQDQWKAILIEVTCHERESVLNIFRTLLNLANINLAYSSDIIRRSSDPILPTNRGQRSITKRQSCTHQ